MEKKKIHSTKSRKENQNSHIPLRGIPSCLVAERVFLHIYLQR